jgi:hypothetical protein
VKLALIYIAALLAVAAALLALGSSPTVARWGAPGIASMRAAVGMCFIAAVIAAIPVAVLAARRSPAAPQACLAGTVIRLLITGLLALLYQSREPVHLRSFLAWLVIAYLSFLTVETILTVVVVRRRWPPPGGGA